MRVSGTLPVGIRVVWLAATTGEMFEKLRLSKRKSLFVSTEFLLDDSATIGIFLFFS